MTALIAAVAVAVISGPIMWLLHRFDKRNSAQHGANQQALDRIEGKLDRHDNKLDRLDDKLTNHMQDRKQHR